MPNERVLIEIITAANMAGVQQAQTGFLGMNPVLLATGLALGGIAVVGEKSIKVAEDRQKADNNLAQAIAETNAQVGKATEAGGDLTKQIAAHDAALRRLAEVEAGMPTKHRATRLELMHLQDAQAKVTLTAKELADAEAATDKITVATAINSKAFQAQIQNFMQTNRDYISNQSDVINSYAQLIRSGLSQAETQRVMNDALDLAALKGISLSDATLALSNAEHGRMRGLIDLGITTAKYTDANGNLIQSQNSVAAAMAEVDAKVKGGRGSTTDYQKALNDLSNDWQDLANRTGPPLIDILGKVAKGLDDAVVAGQGASNDSFWGGLDHQLTDSAAALRRWWISLREDGAAQLAAEDARNSPKAKFGSQDTSGPPRASSYDAAAAAQRLLDKTGQGTKEIVDTIGTKLVPPIGQARIDAQAAALKAQAQTDRMLAHFERIEANTANPPRVNLSFNVQGLSAADAQTARILRKAMQV